MKKLFIKSLAVILVVVLTLTAAPLGGLAGLDLPDLFSFKAEAREYIPECPFEDNIDWNGSECPPSNHCHFEIENGEAIISYVIDDYGTTLAISSSHFGYPVKTIPSNANVDNKLTSIIIPNSVTTIDDTAFVGCTSLMHITIPNSVTTIGFAAFAECTSLKNVTIPNSVTTIDDSAFAGCSSLTNVSIPNSITTISGGAFGGCISLTNVTIPNSVTTIEHGAFAGCTSLTHITIPNSVTTIGDGAFAECTSLKNVTIPGSLTTIGEWVFEDCNSLTSVIFDNGVSTIGYGMFDNCDSLESVTIPDSVTTIDTGAFWGCDSLESVTIPNSVTTICNSAFKDCANLKRIIIPDSVTTIGGEVFYGCQNLEYVHMPAGVISMGASIFAWTGSAYICSTTMFCTARSYALVNGIKFKLCDGKHETDKPTDDNEDKPYKVHGRDFKHNLDYFAKNGNSSKYDPELANMLAALSDAVYNENDIKQAYKELGFDDCEVYDYESGSGPFECGYALAFKQTESGETICLVTVRGSQDLDYNDDHIGNTILFTEDGKHGGFSSPANNIYDVIQSYKENHNISGNIKYVVTGHSRGGAVGNLLSVKLMENGVSSSDVYNYNYACPDVACKFNFPNYNNIFNLCNREDIVPYLPGNICSIFTTPGTSWGKFGKTYWFTKDVPGTMDPIPNHDMDVYLEHFDQQLEPSEWGASFLDKASDVAHTINSWVAKILCPVDVIITDENGNKIASVIGGEINYYDSQFGEVIIFTDGDKKVIYINGDKNFNVNLVGTDTGEMTYSVEKYNIQTEEVLESKTFENVKLEKGKEMQSSVCGDKTADDVSLYVYENNNGEKTVKYVVNTDGSEIEIGEAFKDFAIKQPSVTTVKYGDTLVLNADIGGYTLPAGYTVKWFVEGAGVSTSVSEDGLECRVTSIASGNATIYAKLVDADENVVTDVEGEEILDEITITSKAGFWQKFISFFKNLFRINRIIY